MTYPLGILHLSDCSLPYLFEIKLPSPLPDFKTSEAGYWHTYTPSQTIKVIKVIKMMTLLISLSHSIVMIENIIHKIVLLCNYFLNEIAETPLCVYLYKLKLLSVKTTV